MGMMDFSEETECAENLHGNKDNIVNPDYARQAQRSLSNAKLHIIEDSTHGFHKKA